MMLTNNFWISFKRNGEVWTNIPDGKPILLPSELNEIAKQTSRTFKMRLISENDKQLALENLIYQINTIVHHKTEEVKPLTLEDKRNLQNSIQKMMDFFKEFSFEPNFRFVNTFTRWCLQSKEDGKNYIANYFKLIDNQATNAIIDKMESYEFEEIIETLNKAKCSKQINQRFRIFFGSQGTGKTTKAIELADGNCMVCHSAMLPSDLMEDFKFEDGKAAFKPSALQIAMTSGKKICLDEINLLPFESLRFLQSILDGKKQFEYKGNTIEIKDGFEIIGTMNLTVNGITFALPEPLVDRCYEIKEYKLSAEDLLNCIL